MNPMNLIQEQLINQQQAQPQMQQAQEEAQPQIKLQSEDQKEARLLRSLQSQTDFGPIHVDTVAEGEAIQQVAPARKTYKAQKAEKRRAREEEKRREEEVKRETNGVGNIVAYDIKHQLEDYYTQLSNSFESYFPEDKLNKDHRDGSKNLSGVDTRVVEIMCHGFRTDKTGKPATAADEKYQQEDREIFDAFCSTKYERRHPYLQQLVDEVLSYNLKEDMFSDSSLRSNTANIKTMAERLVCMENHLQDKDNAFFFRELSPVKWNALGQVREIYAQVGTAFTMVCAMKGVTEQNNKYIKEQEVIDVHVPLAKEAVFEYQKKLGEYRSMRDILQSAVAIEQRVGQIGTVEPTKLPLGKFYQHVRSLLKPEVQKLLNLNVKELHTMSDEDILDLYNASLDVDKCLTHKHPDQPKLTMKDELVGKWKREYEHKLTVLRRLAEKAADRKNEAGGRHGGKF